MAAFGGNGGTPFDTGVNMAGIRAVNVWYGRVLDGFEFLYRDDTSSAHVGGRGGNSHVFNVPPGHNIVGMKIRAGAMIDAIQFITDGGLESQRFGGEGGTLHEVWAPPGQSLVGICGRSGKFVDNVCPQFGPATMISGAPTLDLYCIFQCRGGGEGTRLLHCRKGYVHSEVLHPDVRCQIDSALQTAFGELFNNEINGPLAEHFTRLIQTTDQLVYEEEVEVLLEQPCYLYQMVATVPTRLGVVTLWGPEISCMVPLAIAPLPVENDDVTSA